MYSVTLIQNFYLTIFYIIVFAIFLLSGISTIFIIIFINIKYRRDSQDEEIRNEDVNDDENFNVPPNQIDDN